MAERGASGEFDYLIGDLTDADVSSGDNAPVVPEDFDRGFPDDAQSDRPDDGVFGYEPAAIPEGSFDAFDERTWYFEPVPPPWYRTKPMLTVLVATAAAAMALVVSGVLLVFRPGVFDDSTTSVTPTPPTTVVSTESATSAEPPPPPPPPPPETSAEPIDPGPAETYRPRNPQRTTKKEPEIGVTRTPVTRSPISVSPQRPGSRD